MHCESCKFLLEDVCANVPGVISCNANIEEGTLKIEHENAFDHDALAKEIANVGDYRIEEKNP